MNVGPGLESIHCEVVGSLLRPDYLHEARDAHAAGRISDGELVAAQDRAVEEAIALQEECGIEAITDGEMRRDAWTDPLLRSFDGFRRVAADPASRTAVEAAVGAPPVVADRLSMRANVPRAEVSFLQGRTDRQTKATLPSLTYASVLWQPGVSEAAYEDREQYLRHVVELTRQLIAELADAGVTYIQLDAPRYTHMISEAGRAHMERLRIDTSTWLDEMIELDNAVMADFPSITFGVHLCRGNRRSLWSIEGGYDAIAEQLFTTLACDRLLLEYDSARAGTFAPLRFVPSNKTVVLGLVTTKQPELEESGDLIARIHAAEEHVPLDLLALSPQCGFASDHVGNQITHEQQRAKLRRVGEVAAAVWH